MKPLNQLVVTDQYLEHAKRWVSAIKRGENLAVMFFPKTDRLRRLQQFLEDEELMQKNLGDHQFIFHVTDFDLTSIEDKNELYEFLSLQLLTSHIGTSSHKSLEDWCRYLKRENIRVILVIPKAERLFHEQKYQMHYMLADIITQYTPYLSTIHLFEEDIYHPNYAHVLGQATILYQNVDYYQLYDESDSRIFMEYLIKKWNLDLKTAQKERILSKSGGNFWILKEAVRQEIGHSQNIQSESGMDFRLRIIFESFLPSEQELLKTIATGKRDVDYKSNADWQYFNKLHLLTSQNRFTIPGLEDFIRVRTQTNHQLILRNEEILLNNVRISNVFSRKEHRVLKIMLEHKGVLLSRDDIAKAIWPTNTAEQYSDWAIDQIIARLRKRLGELALPPETIKVVRGKGYMLK